MSFITNKTLPRRTFLRGVGATVALPLLESMLPAVGSVARAAQLSPTRFTGIFIPHGAAPGYWVPNGERKLRVAVHLQAARDGPRPARDHERPVVEVVGEPPGVTGADHFVAAAYLSGVKPRKTTGADIECGTTLDQVIAQQIGQDTLLPSLQLAVEDPGANASNCGEGYSCVYTNSISWAAPNRPLPMEVNPQVVFERLFGDGGTPAERLARREQQRSILDSVDGLARDAWRAKVGAPTACASTSISRTCARSSAACRSRRRRRPKCPRSRCRTACRSRSTSTSSCSSTCSRSRSRRDITRVGDAALCPRPHRPRVSRERHGHQLPRRLAPRRGPGPRRAVRAS